MVELEYAPFNQFATEFMVEWFEDLETGSKKFTGFRWENRYRIFKKPVPLNPMAYVEYEDLDPATRYKMEVSGWVRPPYVETEEEPDRERIARHVHESLMLVTALAPHIGYDRAAQIAKKAQHEGSTLKQAALQLGYVSEQQFNDWIVPLDMTHPTT